MPESDETRADPTASPSAFDAAWILFHGHGLLCVNKPPGIPVHGDPTHPCGLAEMINEWVRSNPGVLDIRAGKDVYPVQPLDLEASGAVMFGLRRQIASAVTTALAAGTLVRHYAAVVAGPLDAAGTLEGSLTPRGRRSRPRSKASLEYTTVCSDDRLSLAAVKTTSTGRHLVRALFAQAGRALAGDQRYGKAKPAQAFLTSFNLNHFLLHASKIELPPEILGAEKTLSAPLPAAFRDLAGRKGWTTEPAFEVFMASCGGEEG